MSAPLLDRFSEKYTPVPESGCWLWLGRESDNGYGRFDQSRGKQVRAHRQSWELFISPIPVGLFVLHKCDTRLCVNPEHLFFGTHQDNAEDRAAKGRSAVNRGGGGWNRGIPHAQSHPNGSLGARCKGGAA